MDIYSHGSEGCEARGKAPVDSVSGEGPLPGSETSYGGRVIESHF